MLTASTPNPPATKLKKMKTLLTIGIPTYSRSDHMNERLIDLEKLGYFNHPDVQIIIHDNDSKKKDHCLRIKDLRKTIRNLVLIESSPNIGMVKGCYKILNKANGEWIALLGDDDPIIIRCNDFLSIIRKNKKCDHLYFRTKETQGGQVRKVSWFANLKKGNYTPSEICAKTGFTTHFAHLAAHCFRNKNNLAKIWMASHNKCTFYGHCIMFLENYKRSFYSGKTVSAWRSGNERVSSQFNILMNMELRNLFKYPPTNAIRNFMDLNPRDVRKEGTFPLLNHLNNPRLSFIDRYEHLPKDERIILQEVRPMKFDLRNTVCIDPLEKNKRENFSCVFYQKKDTAKKQTFGNAAVVFMCGPSVRVENIFNIAREMELTGAILLGIKPLSSLMLLAEYCNSNTRKKLWRIHACAILLFSLLMYGLEEFNIPRIVWNYFKRPQKGFYRIIRHSERACRITVRRLLSSQS